MNTLATIFETPAATDAAHRTDAPVDTAGLSEWAQRSTEFLTKYMKTACILIMPPDSKDAFDRWLNINLKKHLTQTPEHTTYCGISYHPSRFFTPVFTTREAAQTFMDDINILMGNPAGDDPSLAIIDYKRPKRTRSFSAIKKHLPKPA